MWPKWQSSPGYGDIPASGLMGNRSYRRRGVNDGEILLDLSRKVYSICHHLYFIESRGACVDSGHSNKPKNKKRDLWPVKVFFLTFMLAMLFNFFSETSMMGASLPVALLVLLFIICVGIGFDIIGIAVTFQDVTAYTAMASKKIPGAKQAIRLVQSAGMVSNICNDVVGDICGIVSGAMGAAISAKLFIESTGFSQLLLGIIVSSVIAACTVGGKALGKRVAMRKSHQIVFGVGKVLSFFSRKERPKGN